VDIRRNVSFRHFDMRDGIVIGMFQGNRGAQRDLDFVVKMLMPGERSRVRTPAHVHWVVSLLIMIDRNPDLATQFVARCNAFYEKAQAFTSKEERLSYQPVLRQEALVSFAALDTRKIYSVESIALMIELFSICEKATPLTGGKTKMFDALLRSLAAYCAGRRDFFQVLNDAAPGF
jgi:hypothetical protein